MIIKKYLAKTEKEAIEMAKNELGSSAIVMNIKTVAPRGLAKLFVKGKVEVTAALDETPPARAEKETPADRPEDKPAAGERDRASAAIPPMPSAAKESAPKEAGEADILADRLSRLQSLLEKQMQAENRQKEKMEKVEKLVSSDQEKKEEKEQEEEKTRACKKLIYEQLLQNEVEKEIADSIMEEVNRSLPMNAALDQILASVYQKIILMIGQSYLIDAQPSDRTRFIFFLGSTGVGKTTTIAKIASRLKLDKKANIALVTADTYRIAAVEQLKTYAGILSVPLKVVYSPGELGDMMEELNQYDICLVDTAGRSHKNKEQIEDIRKLIEQVPIADRQVYLVLNAATKYSDLQEIARVYSSLTDFSLIFTKLDETSSAGSMLNMRIKTKCPLSYVTWGQNVPDDIGEVNAQEIAKRLLGGDGKNSSLA